MLTYTCATDDIEIEYELVDSSFSHEFGTSYVTNFEITKISVYVPAINDWYDVSHVEQFCVLADKLVMNKLAEAA